MLPRRVRIVPLLFCALCASPLEAQRPSPDAAVYGAVLLYTARESREPQLLFDSTSTGPVSGSRFVPARAARFWDAVPKDVQLRFDALNRAAQSLRGLALPATVHLLSRAEWRTQVARLARAHVIDIGSVAVVSRIAYTPDGNAALVEVAWPCDGPCGEGKYYWLRRAASGEWELLAEAQAWVG